MIATLVAAALVLPAPISGDFDGDGRLDRAGFVGSGDAVRIEVRLAAWPGKVWLVPESQGRADALFLDRLQPGRHAPLCDVDDGKRRPCASPVMVTTDAIGFGSPEASMAVAWWTGTAFRTIWTND